MLVGVRKSLEEEFREWKQSEHAQFADSVTPLESVCLCFSVCLKTRNCDVTHQAVCVVCVLESTAD